MMDHDIPLGNIHDFSSKEAQELLHNKFVVILGDSIYRSVYKDLIYILQTDKMLSLCHLQTKGEETFANDCRVEFEGLKPGPSYREVRQYRTSYHLVRFYFITRVYSAYMESILEDFKMGLVPDVLIVSSCLWDLNRYQDPASKEPPIPKALKEYQENMEKLFDRLSDVLPSSCLILWTTATPLRQMTYGSLFKETTKKSTPEEVIEANFYSACLASCYKFDVLDLHYSFRFLDKHHHNDGIHWNRWVHRSITKLLLTHVAEAWGVEFEKRALSRGAVPKNKNAVTRHSTPRHPFPKCLSHQFFGPGSDLPFLQNATNGYGPVPCEIFEDKMGPLSWLGGSHPYSDADLLQSGSFEAHANYSGVSSKWLEEGMETHWNQPSFASDSCFQEDTFYGDDVGESYESDKFDLSSQPPFQPGYSYGTMDSSGYIQEPYPEQLDPSVDSVCLPDSAFSDQPIHEHMQRFLPGRRSPFVGNRGSFQSNDQWGHWSMDDFDYHQPLPRWAVPHNATFPPYSGWHGHSPPYGNGGMPRPWPHPEDITYSTFPPYSPGVFEVPHRPFPPPWGPPRRARGACYSRVMRSQWSPNLHPYKRRRRRKAHNAI